MSVTAHKETLGFQTEVNQLLELMIHSLYSNKEIFVRELVSNGADACDKLRFEALADDGLYESDSELKISIEYDKDARTITITDNGIGMSREEVIEHIGTIAKSGTRAFFDSLSGDRAKDAQLIGQFGVGFYSAFIVADKVTLESRRAGLAAEHGVRWESAGKGEYSLETIEHSARGTTVTLHLKEGEDEFLDGYRLRHIIKTYSDHINLPVMMHAESMGTEDNDETPTWETVNSARALWTRPKGEITDEEYAEFYKHVAHDFEAPLAHSHNRVEGRQEYTSLLYIPKRAPFDLWDANRRYGIKLYVRRVFIMDDAEQLMPNYLRFVRGIIDSNDLPLNVSREILQHNQDIDAIRAGSTKKVLGLLKQLAQQEGDDYTTFWSAFGRVIKEGIVEDGANQKEIAALLRFTSTHDENAGETASLDDYIARMQDDQDAIYYITADSLASATGSPHLEVFRKKGIEVLLLTDRIDEWVVTHLNEYDGKALKSVAKGELDLPEDEADKEKITETHKDLIARLKIALGERIEDVRPSHRLVDSPACLVASEAALSSNMERILKEAGQSVGASKKILEFNPDHALIAHIETEQDEARFERLAQVLMDQAVLAEGGTLEDPAGFVKRLNELLLKLAN